MTNQESISCAPSIQASTKIGLSSSSRIDLKIRSTDYWRYVAHAHPYIKILG
uniref:Uncharacterized protein n=1 Tax=Setaria italica TaxID=4555 RepID=K4AHZ8_SETIT